jgi:hypothetical protein
MPTWFARRPVHGIVGERSIAVDTDYDQTFDDEPYIRTCGRCGRQTSPRWSESSSLEEARRLGWRRVATSDRPGANRLDLCGECADDAGFGPPMARWGY